jgi:hypothetical protein
MPFLSVSRANLGNMRKVPALALVLALSFTGLAPASAATKAQTVTTAFKTLLNTTGDSLDALEQKYESDIDALDATLSAATKAADATLDQEVQAATALYAPQIAAANKKVEDAKIVFKANNKFTIKQSLYNYVDRDRVWNKFICPQPRTNEAGWLIAKRYCVNDYGYLRDGDRNPANGMTIGGEDWQPNDVAEISYENTTNSYIQDAVAYGWIVPLNLALYDSSRLTIKTETANANDLTYQNGKARTSAQTKRDNAVALATKNREAALADLDDAYETAKAQLEAQQTAADLALLAAKRASKDSNFDAAFVVAYKFEYNRQMLDQIADAAWTGDWTFRTIDSIVKVNKLAISGDSIGSRYSKSAASAFNSAVGNAFTNEPDFRAALKVLTAIYKQTTKTTLKF